MNRAWSYLGPLLLFLGTYEMLPDPHPTLGTATALAVAVGGIVVALLGILLARQSVVALGALATVLVTFPVTLPLTWVGPPLQVLGLILSLEGARARGIRTELPPVTAWALPLGLAVLAALVPLVALLTEVGRESLDISQGVGLGVSAPFLLLAIWLGIRALGGPEKDQESTGSGTGSGTGSNAAIGTGVTALLLVLLVVLMVPIGAEAGNHEPTPNQGTFEDEAIRVQFQVSENRSINVTGSGWTLNNSNVLLIDPGIDQEQVANWTFRDATLEVPLDGGTPLDCQDTQFTLSRLNGTWAEATLLEDVPERLDPIQATWSSTACSTLDSLTINATAHFQAWADGAPIDGWQLAKTTQGGERTGTGDQTFSATYERNPPTVESIETTPGPKVSREDADEEIVMVPVGQPFLVNASVDEKDLLRNASVRIDDEVVLNQSVTGNEAVNLTLQLTEAQANGTLSVRVDDWDLFWDHRFGDEVRPDEEVPVIQPEGDLPIQVQGTTWSLPAAEAIAEGEEATLAFNLTDDSCHFVVACVTTTARTANGTLLDEFTGNTSHTLELPTEDPGPKLVILETTDAALRTVTVGFFYNVSEDRSPNITALTATGFGGRQNLQEAGLPIHLNATVSDESPKVTVRALLEGQELATTQVTSREEAVSLVVSIEDPGEHELTLEATDRWGNTANASRLVEIKPDLAPVVTLPDGDFLRPETTLTATVLDSSVRPSNVTVEVSSAGQPLSGVEVAKEPIADGVRVEISIPVLLHGEGIQIAIVAVDAGGRSGEAQASYTADRQAPEIEVVPSIGRQVGTDLWTTANASLLVSAQDPDSGVARFDLVAPITRPLAAQGTQVNVSDLGEDEIRIEAVDGVDNAANWTGELRIDTTPPRLNVTIDGHDLLVDIQENESGLAEVIATADGQRLTIPAIPGAHSITLQDVVRGDVVNVTVNATDRVLQTAVWSGNVTVGDAPPEVTFLGTTGTTLRLTVQDADGDEVDVDAIARHRVNGTEQPLELDGEEIALPDWRGDVLVELTATSFQRTVTASTNVTLGTGPFLHAQLPGDARAGEPITVAATWERAYENVELLVERDGVQVALLDLQTAEPGHGTAEVNLEEAGTYQLTLSGHHEEGTVDTASVGELSVDQGTSIAVLVVGVLVVILIVGVVALDRVIRARDDELEEGA